MGVYQPQRTKDEGVNRNLDAIAAQLRELGAAQAAFGLGGGMVAYPVTSFAIDGEAMVSFRGATAATVTLPGALSLGTGIMREVTIVNDGTAAVTVAAGVGDGLSGSAAVGAGTKSVWRSDGDKKWHRVV